MAPAARILLASLAFNLLALCVFVDPGLSSRPVRVEAATEAHSVAFRRSA